MKYLRFVLILILLLIAGCERKVEQAMRQPAQVRSIPQQTSIQKIPAASELIHGCIGSYDCIPSLDKPLFVGVKEADHFLEDTDEVIGVIYQGEAKAYPIKILNWHEVVNDRIRELPVAITYCPLCGTAIVYERMLDSKPVEFGVSGFLHNSCLVLYDRATKTLWDQVGGIGISGAKAGERLRQLPSIVTTWERWKMAYPHSTILTARTGYTRNYNVYPYGDYRTNAEIMFPVSNASTTRHPKEIVYGVIINGTAQAYQAELPESTALLEDTIESKSIVIMKDPVSGSVRMFDAAMNGQTLHFMLKDGKIYENATNSEFTADGRGITRPYKDIQLQELPLARAYWFAWYAFYPTTKIAS